MRMTETISTNPIGVEKTVRGDEIRALTSCRAGRIVPVTYIPLLREDSVRRGSLRLQLKMDETIHPLMNAVNVTAYAHFVPMTAFDRFKQLGMDAYNRSYKGEGEPHNDTPIPYFLTKPFTPADTIYRHMGIHAPDLFPLNASLIEAYNAMVNFRREARSQHLPLRGALHSSTLAQAFWKNTNVSHIVPDFDQAAMDGEVELQWADPFLPVTGIGKRPGTTPVVQQDYQVHEGFQSTSKTYPNSVQMNGGNMGMYQMQAGPGGWPAIYAELQNSGIKLSLANLELAKKTAAFAKLAEQYNGVDEDHVLDLLMEGIRVPDEQLKQPILLDRASSIFGYSERHATDGDNLDKSVTTGMTELTLNFRTPPMNVQGVILVTVEIVPEQLYERMEDHFLTAINPDTLPNFMRDYLDPEKVSVVQNRHVDVLHGTPEGTFGYAPLNHEWKRSLTRVGGKYYRPVVDTFTEDRQRFWSVEKQNPKLTEDFYLVPENLPHTVFADMLADPFEILTLGSCEIVGRTVFGKVLKEDDGHYDRIMSQVDTGRIQQ